MALGIRATATHKIVRALDRTEVVGPREIERGRLEAPLNLHARQGMRIAKFLRCKRGNDPAVCERRVVP